MSSWPSAAARESEAKAMPMTCRRKWHSSRSSTEERAPELDGNKATRNIEREQTGFQKQLCVAEKGERACQSGRRAAWFVGQQAPRETDFSTKVRVCRGEGLSKPWADKFVQTFRCQRGNGSAPAAQSFSHGCPDRILVQKVLVPFVSAFLFPCFFLCTSDFCYCL